LLDMEDSPSQFEQLLDFCTEVAVAYGLAMPQTGVDGIQFGESSASLGGSSVFEKLVLPRDRRLIRALQEAGVHTFLHVCENSNHLLPLLARSGADCLELDSAVDLDLAFGILENRAVVRGTVDTRLLLNRPIPEIKAAAATCLRQARVQRGRLILSPSCGVPKHTPTSHITAGLVETAREFTKVWNSF